MVKQTFLEEFIHTIKPFFKINFIKLNTVVCESVKVIIKIQVEIMVINEA